MAVLLLCSIGPFIGTADALNLGERALSNQAEKLQEKSAPLVAEFDPQFLSGMASSVDLSGFSRGNPLVAGSYRSDVYLNGSWKGRRDLEFSNDASGNVTACLGLQTLEEFDIDTSLILAKNSIDKAECRAIHNWLPDAYAVFEPSTLRYDLSVPQMFLRRIPRGYISPALWDRGINAGFIGYSFNATGSNSRDHNESVMLDRSAYLGINAGLNIAGWQLRHDSNLSWRSSRRRGAPKVIEHRWNRSEENLEDDGIDSRPVMEKGLRKTKRDINGWHNIASYAQRGIPSLRAQLTIGDAYTRGELFDSIAYRGISLVSDDRMLPDSLRGYAPVVRGVAETNARVEIRQNQQLIYSTTVAPGSFVIDDLYPTGYGADLEVSVLEADGRHRRFKLPYGSVAQMLRPGSSRYALTVGEARNAYLDAKPWFLQATYQRGVANQLSVYAGSSLSEGYAALLYGAGVSTALGAVALDLTHARTELRSAGKRQGASVRLSYNNVIRHTDTGVTLAAYRYSTAGFSSLQDAMQLRNDESRGHSTYGHVRQRSQLQVSLNQPLRQRWGSFYLTGSRRDYYDRIGSATQYQFGYANYWRTLNYGFSAIRSQEHSSGRDTEYMFSVNVPLGGKRPISLSSDINFLNGYQSSRVGMIASAGADENLSYGVNLSNSHGGDSSASVNADWRSRYTTLNSSYSHASHYRQASLGAVGSIVLHAGGLTLAPQRGDTMVLVEAPAARNAQLSNVPGLRIDGRGYAVVPYVSPYRMNTITLDPQGMSDDVELESSSQSVAPYAGAISHVKFQTRQGRALLISVRNVNGEPLPFGAQVDDAQGQPAGMVGQGGRLYVRSAEQSGKLRAYWGELPSQQCHLDYKISAEDAPTTAGFIQLEAACR